MKPRAFLFLLALLLFILFPPPSALSASDTESEIRDLTGGTITLAPGDLYQSQYSDIRRYRYVSIYVLEEKVLNSPQAPFRYQLDAIFSVNTDFTGFQDSDSKTGAVSLLHKGWQEFGSSQASQEGSVGSVNFNFTSTGPTSSRVLFAPVYGPFVRVELQNLLEDRHDVRSFRIIAYLIP